MKIKRDLLAALLRIAGGSLQSSADMPIHMQSETRTAWREKSCVAYQAAREIQDGNTLEIED